VPSLRGARRASKRLVCAGNLHSIGHGLRIYLNESNDFLPVVETLPSVPVDEDNPRPSIAEVLLPHIRKNADLPGNSNSTPEGDYQPNVPKEKVFHCPDDLPGRDPERTGVNQTKTYFDTEGSSYMFNTRLRWLLDNMSFTDGAFDKPVKLSEIVRSNRAQSMFGGQPAEEEIWLMRDYFGFHGKEKEVRRMNFLYVDGRVADLVR
jgi:prepilin-type processing-associated H-X9-DG protein